MWMYIIICWSYIAKEAQIMSLKGLEYVWVW